MTWLYSLQITMFCEGRRAMEGREVVGKSSGGEVMETDEKEQTN